MITLRYGRLYILVVQKAVAEFVLSASCVAVSRFEQIDIKTNSAFRSERSREGVVELDGDLWYYFIIIADYSV
jgi:hypothetical protein